MPEPKERPGRPFNDAALSGLFRSFSHRVRSYLASLEQVTAELEIGLVVLDLPEYAKDQTLMNFRNRMRDLISHATQSAKGQQ